MHRWSLLFSGSAVAGLALLFGTLGTSCGQEPYNPKIAGPSDEGLKAIKRIRVPAGTVATLVAAEPLLANPVCFCFDEQGNLYVAETHRLHAVERSFAEGQIVEMGRRRAAVLFIDMARIVQ